ncbi:hypothetical protein L2E82_15347 [Cichorium intybus]|uniref:Uncharacterized protein n=1 Tax=Cichorium intybus TaxID=13427 RepID=A0ACB9F2H8_CICIN|nr:hypothetical protein L2E82_15347 [Cichorium intybus]
MNLDRFWFGSPPDLVHDESRSDWCLENISRETNGSSISTKHGTVEESGEIVGVLVNTNQFYKWFTDLEAAMKSQGKQSICIEHKHKNTEINDLGLERDDSAYVLGKNVLPI